MTPETKERPVVYEIKVEGLIDDHWSEWFGDMSITRPNDTDSVLTGELPDQAALQGVLTRIRDLGLKLVSVRRVDENQ